MTAFMSAAKGAKWTLGCQLFISAAQFLVSAITSRLFLPAEFGGFAASLSLMALMTLMTTTGLPSFILKENELARNHVRSIRAMAAGVGLLTGLVYLGVAPIWLALLRAPEGIQFIALMAVAQALGPIGNVESALLRRETNLGRDATSLFVTFVLTSGAGVALALWLKQPWTLGVPAAGAPLVMALISRFLQLHVYAPGSPLQFRGMLSFSRKITVQNMGFMLLQQAPGWIVSMSLGAGALGQFSKAGSLAQMPATALTTVQSRIAQPRWRHAGGLASFQEVVSDAVLISAGLAFPAFAVLAVNGSVLLDLWLGPGWELAGAMVAPLAVGYGISIPFTLMAGSFEMRGKFAPARAAQWCMAGALIPPLTAMIVFRDVSWGGWAIVISQAAAFACLVAAVDWQSPQVRHTLIAGILKQIGWASAIGLAGFVASRLAWGSPDPGGYREPLELMVAFATSGLLWVLTFRWQATSAVLGRRGLKLPRLLRPARV